MKMIRTETLFLLMMSIFFLTESQAQDKEWTLEECIDYSLSKNIDVQKSELTIQQYDVLLKQTKYNRLPSLNASVNNNISWLKRTNSLTGEYGSFNDANNTSYGLSSNITLFNGNKLKTQTDQARLNLQSGKYYSESIKESVELNILDAYLNILFAREEVNNAQQQIESTTGELILAEERMHLGIISQSDYLQIKSELASEKLTLADANSTLTMAGVNLMQLMELPVKEEFNISSPDIDSLISSTNLYDAAAIYQYALKIKPQIKEAELDIESNKMDEKIAKADLFPSLTLNASTNTAWQSNISGYNYSEQLNNAFTPSVCINLSIPIFQKNQVKTNIKLAQISVNNALLEETQTKNNLRKEIEQAVANVNTAQIRYEASVEQYHASKESYLVAAEKFKLGILNSVEFLIVKNDMITSQSSLLQTKYNLVFSNKIIDFYRGISIRLLK